MAKADSHSPLNTKSHRDEIDYQESTFDKTEYLK